MHTPQVKDWRPVQPWGVSALFVPLILASTSPYRRSLLARLGLPFEVVSPGVEETHLAGEPPAQRALRLAQLKAQAVSLHHPGAVVIGSDQVASRDGQVLDKPGDAARCRAQLALLCGHTAVFHTACTVVPGEGRRPLIGLDITTVVFRTLQPAEIERFIEREQPFDCPGGVKAEGAGIALFERIESIDPTALIGLPLIWLSSALRQAGYRLP